jgi:Lon protease-like protein
MSGPSPMPPSSSSMPDNIALFPLSQGVFPDGMLRLQIFEPRYLDLMKRCFKSQQPFGVVWLKKGREVQTPGDEPQFFATGCLAHIRRLDEIQPALLHIVCQGGLRFELLQHQPGPYGVWQGQVKYMPPDPDHALPAQYQAHADQLGQAIAQAQQLGRTDQLPLFAPYRLDDAGWVANRFAEVLPLPADIKVDMLSESDPLRRMQTVANLYSP